MKTLVSSAYRTLFKCLFLVLWIANPFSNPILAADLPGVWLNEKTTGSVRIISGLTKMIISGDEKQIRVYEKCRPDDCDWGIARLGRVRPIQGKAHHRAIYDTKKEKRILQIYQEGDNRLVVKIQYTFKDNRPGKTTTYSFRKQPESLEKLNAEYYGRGKTRSEKKVDAVLPQQGLIKGLDVSEVDGTYILQGDIMLTNKNVNPSRYLQQDDDLMTVQQSLAGKLSFFDDWKWDYGKIPYRLHLGIETNPVLKKRVEDAVKMINDNTVLNIVKRGSEEDYIQFKFEAGTCSSCIGRQGGMQYINISEDCEVGNIAHEILHAAGFYHEHTRNDRNDYVNIEWSNIEWGKEGNFSTLFIEAYTPYDYGSIMHYGPFAFNDKAGARTIIPNRSNVTIGQRNGLSPLDITGVNKVYAKDKWYVSNSGNTAWQSINSSKVNIQNLVVADFDGNGQADVLYINSGRWRISYDGKGAWKQVNKSDVERSNLGFGDFNGDGKMDVFYGNGKQWYVSYGATTGWQYLNKSGLRAGDLRFGDFNGDGKTDVFHASGSAWKISYGGKGGWRTVNRSDIQEDKLGFGDFNGDGATDVFYPNGRTWMVSDNATRGWRRINTSSITYDKLAIGDFNGDRIADVFYGNGKVWKISYNGTGQWIATGVSSYTKSDLRFGDFDKDGKTDVFSAR